MQQLSQQLETVETGRRIGRAWSTTLVRYASRRVDHYIATCYPDDPDAAALVRRGLISGLQEGVRDALAAEVGRLLGL